MPTHYGNHIKSKQAVGIENTAERIFAILEQEDNGRCQFRSKGINNKCFPVLSFGEEDADLDITGCSGIKNLYFDENGVTAEIGLHVTVCDPCDGFYELPENILDEFQQQTAEIVSGAYPILQGTWESYFWDLGWTQRVTIKWQSGETEQEQDRKTVDALLAAVNAALEPVKAKCRILHELLDKVYEELEEMYVTILGK
jgi:hypothetical protein